MLNFINSVGCTECKQAVFLETEFKKRKGGKREQEQKKQKEEEEEEEVRAKYPQGRGAGHPTCPRDCIEVTLRTVEAVLSLAHLLTQGAMTLSFWCPHCVAVTLLHVP